MNTKKRPKFDIGDIIFDVINKDVGVLLRNYYLFDGFYDVDETEDVFHDILVWDIYWTGPNMWIIGEPVQTYTEEGLEILLNSGVLEHYKNI